jgi:hypothetical protein
VNLLLSGLKGYFSYLCNSNKITIITMKKLFYLFGLLLFASFIFTACSGNRTSVSVARVALNRATMAVGVGGAEALIVTIVPANATNRDVVWTSSDSTIATVDANGVVTGVSLGTAIITVTTADGEKTASSRAMVVQFDDTLDGVVIGNRRWATRNVDAPGTFAAAPTDAGMFYQWNRRVGWSSANPAVNSAGGTTWDSSIPAGTAWYPENDPCPAGWRVPTEAELDALRTPGSIMMTYNGVRGRLFGAVPDIIFFPAAGWRYHTDGRLDGVDIISNYWSNARLDDESAWDLWFNSGGVAVGGSYFRAGGLSVRCVAVE